MLINKARFLFLFFLLVVFSIQTGLKEEDLEVISRCFFLEDSVFLKPLVGGIANAPTYVFMRSTTSFWRKLKMEPSLPLLNRITS